MTPSSTCFTCTTPHISFLPLCGEAIIGSHTNESSPAPFRSNTPNHAGRRNIFPLLLFLVCHLLFTPSTEAFCPRFLRLSAINEKITIQKSSIPDSNQCERLNMSQDNETETQKSGAAAAVEFARLAGGLKTTPRTGWVRRQVPKYESVADHSWRVAVLSLLLPEDEFDVSRCMAMGLVHDMAESLTGDFCPEDNVSKDDKHRMEVEAMKRIAEALNCSFNPENGKDSVAMSRLLDLFHEYEERESKEAIAVKDIDMLDMIMQAEEYEKTFGNELSEFFVTTPPSKFSTPLLREIASRVHMEREARKAKEADEKTDEDGLTASDNEFVTQYAKGSALSSTQIEEVVQALRQWEKP